jgi:hypothetical protein
VVAEEDEDEVRAEEEEEEEWSAVAGGAFPKNSASFCCERLET